MKPNTLAQVLSDILMSQIVKLVLDHVIGGAATGNETAPDVVINVLVFPFLLVPICARKFVQVAPMRIRIVLNITHLSDGVNNIVI